METTSVKPGSTWGQWWWRWGWMGSQMNSQGTDRKPRWQIWEQKPLTCCWVRDYVQDCTSRGYRWERGAIWGMRSRLAQRLWDQREQCFSISFPVSFNIHLNSSFSKWGTWELWRGDGYPTFGNCLNSLVQKCVQVMLPSYYPSSQVSSPFSCLRCLGKKKCT